VPQKLSGRLAKAKNPSLLPGFDPRKVQFLVIWGVQLLVPPEGKYEH
jgi:hypothetical protein